MEIRDATPADETAFRALWGQYLAFVLTEDCYLEDLFVSPDARGHGLGRALIDDLITLARAKGWARLYWHTNEANTRARALYDQYVQSDGHIRYRLPL
ncbi:MAG: hypothetical protein B7Z10_12885 [Rhodobacterales bacterium 32-66-7]|nr:MAG: hypothetical protein B7Z10_12885 [Rhodobacterales bacterium 32-66-7]